MSAFSLGIWIGREVHGVMGERGQGWREWRPREAGKGVLLGELRGLKGFLYLYYKTELGLVWHRLGKDSELWGGVGGNILLL
jgi:hypothetical protein